MLLCNRCIGPTLKNKLSTNIHSSQTLKWEFLTEQPVYYYNVVPHGMTSGFSIMKYSLNAAWYMKRQFFFWEKCRILHKWDNLQPPTHSCCLISNVYMSFTRKFWNKFTELADLDAWLHSIIPWCCRETLLTAHCSTGHAVQTAYPASGLQHFIFTLQKWVKHMLQSEFF